MVFHKHNLPRLLFTHSGIIWSMTQSSARSPQPYFDWSQIDDVLLDMDGTLLDRHFDNFFFDEELPRRYAALHRLSFQESRDRLMAMYRSVEGELAWTDLNYWTRRVGIDVVAMHKELDHMIGFLPGAEEFLRHLQQLGKRVTIITNAHSTGVSVKISKTGLDRYVDRIVDAFEVGYLKMRPEYWPNCQRLLGFDPSRSLFMDDDEGCLTAAKAFGVAHLVHSAKSSSELPPAPLPQFFSVTGFTSLLNGRSMG
ncbi:putative HAD-like hydrolase, purine nucleotidase [Candidatus Nitrospira nitrosa]|uniref:Putative HAD-like hydrolase, purine nucleotidase n=2 Tax=Candidatus Nitrospira nitrosa TaxID=1742972 RepID=A0A0S4LAY4_9BACT|nr:putative HAD-like hydrolase, purine nucleotidase [Candidatus Nitrospira nitrosa]